ncbi:hypothetical protein [Cystobacter ferrugineus]|jgi:pyruvate/oxaloacetate carboxyltransferase|uniref:hypothetical protein n=1 Tax=Cystobacter ferrugineus TaxID=83449 RepID=UPI000A448FBB|nr:hypothetical protein [Cystobacter ferrugineus]
MALRTVLRRLIQSRMARRILAAVLAVVVAELNDAGSYSRSSYGNSRYDGGAHSEW